MECKHQATVLDVKISPDDKFMATSSADQTVRCWEFLPIPTRKPFWIGYHESYVQALDFSSDGKRLASVGGDRICRVWNAQTGGLLLLLRSSGALNCVSFSPAGNYIAFAGLQGSMGVWRMEEDASPAGNLVGEKNPVVGVRWISETCVIFMGSGGATWVWDGRSRRVEGIHLNSVLHSQIAREHCLQERLEIDNVNSCAFWTDFQTSVEVEGRKTRGRIVCGVRTGNNCLHQSHEVIMIAGGVQFVDFSHTINLV